MSDLPETSMEIPEHLWPLALYVLYAAAKPLGLGWVQYIPGPMPIEEATKLIQESRGRLGYTHLDYVHGRPIKVFFKDGAVHRLDLYDRDQGEGLGRRLIERLLDHASRTSFEELNAYYSRQV